MTLKRSIIFSLFVILLGTMAFPLNPVFGHGMGIDFTSFDVDGKKVEVSVEIPLYFEDSENKLITVNTIDKREKENIKNVTFLIIRSDMLLRTHRCVY